jgi:uncharacterized YccA/Bax inhibitor family protein
MRTTNPALNEAAFERQAELGLGGATMTVQGTVGKTLLLTLILMVSASWLWARFYAEGAAGVIPWLIGGVIAGLVIGIATGFLPRIAPYSSPFYALAEGLVVGGLSALVESQYPGIAIQAVGLTMGVLITMLLVYMTGLVQVTDQFRTGLMAATGAVFLVYLASFVLSFFNIRIPYIHEGGTIGIIFSVVVIVIAALNLVLDFDLIERGSAAGAPKYMEWYAAFGLLVTLVWLYIEILRLLSKMRR